MELNKKKKNGSWSLSGDYLDYRKEGKLSPGAWNQIQKDLLK